MTTRPDKNTPNKCIFVIIFEIRIPITKIITAIAKVIPYGIASLTKLLVEVIIVLPVPSANACR